MSLIMIIALSVGCLGFILYGFCYFVEKVVFYDINGDRYWKVPRRGVITYSGWLPWLFSTIRCHTLGLYSRLFKKQA